MKLQFITAIISGLLIVGCGAQLSNSNNGSGNGSTSTTFTLGTGDWKIEAESGQGTAVVLLSGKFGADSNAYPDLALVTSTGVYMYKNRAPVANGWNTTPGRIDATAGSAYKFGISFDIDLDSDSDADFFLYRQSPGRFEVLTNNGNDTFSQTDSSSVTTNTSWMAAASFKNRSASNNLVHVLSVSDVGGVHRISRLDDGEFVNSADATVNGITSAIRAFASDVNSDGFVDFIVIPPNASPKVLLNDEDDSFSDPVGTFTGYSASKDTLAATIGDFDVDGKMDVLLATTGGLEVYINKSTGDEVSFQKNTDASFSVNPTDASWVEFGNLTEDDNFDIIVARNGNAPVLLSGQGSLVFQDISTAAWGTQINSTFGSNSAAEVSQIYILDVDQDRVNDLVMLNDDGDITVFFNNAEDSADAD